MSTFKRKITIAIIASFVLTFSVGIFVVLADGDVIPDVALKQALKELADDEDDILTQEEIEALTGDLNLSGKGISDITGLEFATGISGLDLSQNNIKSIQALEPLVEAETPALQTLNISNNFLDLKEGSDDAAVIAKLKAKIPGLISEPQKPIAVESIAIDKTSLTLFVNDKATITASVSPHDATDKTIVWESSDTDVATVVDGVVTAVASGTATITASSSQNSGVKATCAVTVQSGSIESSKYAIDRSRKFLMGLPKYLPPSQLMPQLKSDTGNIVLCDKNGSPCQPTYVGTGMSVSLSVGGAARDSLNIVVTGDVNGDGAVSISDYTLTRLHILGLNTLNGVYQAASDLNSDGSISITDYTMIRLDILGIKPISAPNLPDVSDSRIRAFLDVALAQQGKPYVWSTEGPSEFDCSGYVYYCLRRVGYKVGRTTANSYSNYQQWPYVPRDQLQPGDLMFYKSDKNPNLIGHIGIYLGNGYHIHASSDYGCVIICRIDGWYDQMLSFGRRVFN